VTHNFAILLTSPWIPLVDYFKDKQIPKSEGSQCTSSPKLIATLVSKVQRVLVVIACCGIPPDYDARFADAQSKQEETFQPDTWESFIDHIKTERSNMNILVGTSIFIWTLQISDNFCSAGRPYIIVRPSNLLLVFDIAYSQLVLPSHLWLYRILWISPSF